MIIATALITEPCASTTAAIRPSTISEKYSGAPNDWPTMASGGANVAISAVRDAAGEERPERRYRQRRPGTALPRHLVPVDAGDDRGGFARKIYQNGGGRAAILRAVEDPGEHDEARGRLEVKGQRQQHGDGGDGTYAGEDADQRPDQGADEGEEQVQRRHGDAEAERRGYGTSSIGLELRPDRDRQPKARR